MLPYFNSYIKLVGLGFVLAVVDLIILLMLKMF